MAWHGIYHTSFVCKGSVEVRANIHSHSRKMLHPLLMRGFKSGVGRWDMSIIFVSGSCGPAAVRNFSLYVPTSMVCKSARAALVECIRGSRKRKCPELRNEENRWNESEMAKWIPAPRKIICNDRSNRIGDMKAPLSVFFATST